MNGWSIGKKLYLGVASMVVLLILSGAVAFDAMASMQGNMEQTTGVIARRTELTVAIAAMAQDAWAAEKSALASSFMRDRTNAASYRNVEREALQKIASAMNELKPLLVSEVDKQATAKIEAHLDRWQQGSAQVYSLIDKNQASKALTQSRAATEPLYNDVVQFTQAIRTRLAEQAAAQREQNGKAGASARWLLIGLIAASILIGLLTGWAVRNIVGTVRGTVVNLSNGGEQAAAASSQIASSSQDLSQGASEQAASLEQVSASMEEMTAMTKRNAENSAEATAMMSETVAQVARSNSALKEMVASMESIKVSSEKVARINKTIDEIAFQTNILALNAAVEAARAGEAGMGFAVVADEVRNLAQRSAVAAKDTAALIEEAIANSNQGAARLEQAATAIRGITDSANKVKGLVDEVNEASRQQTVGIAEATKAILQASHVTQATAASAEESASAAEQLSAQSEAVSDLVRQLRAVVDGSSDDRLFRGRKPAPGRIAKVNGKSAVLAAAAASRTSIKMVTPSREEMFPMETSGTGSFRSFNS